MIPTTRTLEGNVKECKGIPVISRLFLILNSASLTAPLAKSSTSSAAGVFNILYISRAVTISGLINRSIPSRSRIDALISLSYSLSLTLAIVLGIPAAFPIIQANIFTSSESVTAMSIPMSSIPISCNKDILLPFPCTKYTSRVFSKFFIRSGLFSIKYTSCSSCTKRCAREYPTLPAPTTTIFIM